MADELEFASELRFVKEWARKASAIAIASEEGDTRREGQP